MKIIYITTSIEENDYVEFSKTWSVSLNPSNQNFHNKVIRALAISNLLEVISIRPFSKRRCSLKRLSAEDKIVNNISYHYLRIPRHKLFKAISIKSQFKKFIAHNNEKVVVVTDTINPSCVQLAAIAKKKYHIPCIGICTDSPANISGTNRAYALFTMNNTKHMDGYLTLTEELNNLFNPSEQKHLTFEGIVESKEIEKTDVKGKYVFFGGALLPRYGIYELIEAFKKIKNEDISLLICGHHGNEEKINLAINGDNRIKFLGTLPVKEVLALESNAIVNVNPRPFTKELDRLSIPSKTLEYLSSGALTISVKNTELEKKFNDCAIWSKSGSVDDLYFALTKALSMTANERKYVAEKAKNIAKSLYSIEKIGKLLTDFLSTFID